MGLFYTFFFGLLRFGLGLKHDQICMQFRMQFDSDCVLCSVKIIDCQQSLLTLKDSLDKRAAEMTRQRLVGE